MAKRTITRAIWDYKEDQEGIFTQLQKALEPFNIYVHFSEECRGSDSFGFVFAKAELDEDDVASWEDKEFGSSDDEDEEDDDYDD